MEKINILNDEEEKKLAKKMALFYTDNIPSAALTISSVLGDIPDINTLIEQINDLTCAVGDGNTQRVEGALIVQSKTLGVLFNAMTTRAVRSNDIDEFRTYLDMAFRAQNQCRKTLLALNSIQHPQKPTIVKQQNVALNQQINNNDLSQPKKIYSENELLKEIDYAPMDIRTPTQAVAAHTPMEAMATIDRGKDSARKSCQ